MPYQERHRVGHVTRLVDALIGVAALLVIYGVVWLLITSPWFRHAVIGGVLLVIAYHWAAIVGRGVRRILAHGGSR